MSVVRAGSLGRDMKYTVYILRDIEGKIYKGVTNNLERRLREHHNGNTRTTSMMKEVTLAYKEELGSFKEARKREVYFKSAAGRRFLKKILGP